MILMNPTDLHLSNLTLDMNTSYETSVATLSTTDPDSDEFHIYSFDFGKVAKIMTNS